MLRKSHKVNRVKKSSKKSPKKSSKKSPKKSSKNSPTYKFRTALSHHNSPSKSTTTSKTRVQSLETHLFLDKIKNGKLLSKDEVKEIKKMLKSLGEQIKDEKIRLDFKNVLTLLRTIKEDRLLTTEEKDSILQATKSRFAHSARGRSNSTHSDTKCPQCNEKYKVEMVRHGVDRCDGFLKDEYGDDTRIPCRADAKCSSCDKRLCHNCWKTNLCPNPQCKNSRPPTPPLDPLGHVSYAMPFFVLIGIYASIGNSTGIEANTFFGLVFIILMSAYLSSRK